MKNTKEDLKHAEIVIAYESHNFPNAESLYKIIKKDNENSTVTKKDVKDYLNNQQEHQMLTITREKKKTLGHITATFENQFWQMDIYDLSKYHKTNKPYKYILCCVDVFTRKAYCAPIESKNINDVLHAFKIIISKHARAVPKIITSDSDSTFLSDEFQTFLKKLGITHNTVILNDHHALGIVDRFARTLKTILSKYYIRFNTTNWIDILQRIINNYNNTKHTGILKLSPNEAQDKENEDDLIKYNILKSQKNNIVSDLKSDDSVRVKISKTFKKGTEPNFSDEVYKVVSVHGQAVTLNNGEIKKISTLLKVPNGTVSKSSNVIKEVNKQQRKQRLIKQAGVDEVNIVRNKREVKKKDILDL